MVQLDGFKGNPCTCFMFMKPKDKVKQMLVLWLKAISETEAQINQVRFSPAGTPFEIYLSRAISRAR